MRSERTVSGIGPLSEVSLVERQSAVPERATPFATVRDPLAQFALRAAHGDPSSTRELVKRLIPPLARFLRSSLPPGDAEDSMQDSLLAILSALPAFRGHSTFLHFSIGVARRTLSARRRNLKRQFENEARALQLELPLLDLHSDSDPAMARRRSVLVQLIAELPERQARVMIMLVLAGFSLKETALATGAPVNTVRTRFRLARCGLRKRIAADASLRELLTE